MTSSLRGIYSQVRETIVLEVFHLVNYEPNTIKPICTLIADYIKTTPNIELITQFGLKDFEINTLSIERTFCEKIISLVRFSYSENPLVGLSKKGSSCL